MKQLLTIVLLTFSFNVLAEWTEFSTKSNGDVFYFDNARVEKNGDEISVWTRVRYKTSVMAASSFQSLLKLDCSENSETIVQSTFFTDKHWSNPAMATNTNVKPKTYVKENSATAQLIRILCKE
ncbi:MAG: surface-adhesin E family protein [Halioglobus sp.]